MYDLLVRFQQLWWQTPVAPKDLDILAGLMAMLTLVVLSQGAVTLYGCWLTWLSADRLQAVVGGKESSWSEWCRLYYRIAWFDMVAVLLGLVAVVGNWLVSQAIAYQAERLLREY
jgi:hypothetical protein